MNKVFLLLALTTAHISLNASHAAQIIRIIRRPQEGMGLPTLCVGDRFITIWQSNDKPTVVQQTQELLKKKKQTAHETKEQDRCQKNGCFPGCSCP